MSKHVCLTAHRVSDLVCVERDGSKRSIEMGHGMLAVMPECSQVVSTTKRYGVTYREVWYSLQNDTNSVDRAGIPTRSSHGPSIA